MTDKCLKELEALCVKATPPNPPASMLDLQTMIAALPELITEIRRLRFCLDYGIGEEDLVQYWDGGDPPSPL